MFKELVLKQRLTCNGCKALNHLFRDMDCQLGYPNKGDVIPFYGIRKTEPQEPCLKPMNIKEFITAKKLKDNHRMNYTDQQEKILYGILSTSNKEKWLTTMKFAMPTLLDNQPFLIEAIIKRAAIDFDIDRPSDTMHERITQLIKTLQLELRIKSS